MKQLLILIFLPICLSAQITIGDVTWETDYDTAHKMAKKEKKNMLVYFTGSDWCGPCKMLKKDLYETSTFTEIAEEYVLLYIDIPRNSDLLSAKQTAHNKDLLRKLNKKGVFPYVKVLTAKEKVVNEHSGYGMNGDVSFYLNFLEKSK